MTDKLIRRNITLRPQDYTIVRQHAQQWGQSFSGALRHIIREWQHLKSTSADPASAPVRATPVPHTCPASGAARGAQRRGAHASPPNAD